MSAVIRIGDLLLTSTVYTTDAAGITAPVGVGPASIDVALGGSGITAPVALAAAATTISTTNLSVTATPVALTVSSPATAIDIVIYSLASGAMSAGITAEMSATPSGISPPVHTEVYAPIIVAVKVTGTIQCVPPPIAPPLIWEQVPRLLANVVITYDTPAIVNGQPCLPTYWGQCESSGTVT